MKSIWLTIGVITAVALLCFAQAKSDDPGRAQTPAVDPMYGKPWRGSSRQRIEDEVRVVPTGVRHDGKCRSHRGACRQEARQAE